MAWMARTANFLLNAVTRRLPVAEREIKKLALR
jgi:hypothetical protein